MLLQNRILLVVTMLFLSVASVKSQQYSSEGTEFYLSFIIPISNNPHCDVTFSSNTNTTVTIENTGKFFSETHTVTAGIPYTISVAAKNCVSVNNDMVEYGALHITSTDPITVYSMNYISYVADGALVYPKGVCGSEYYTASYEAINSSVPAKFIAVAFEDNTILNITPSTTTLSGHKANVTYTVTLNKGQTYMELGINNQDLSGTHIVEANNKNFAVFSGTECVNIPTSCAYCDVIMEQVLPVSVLGKKYLLAPLSSNTVVPKYTYRIIAPYSNTEIKIDGILSNTLQKGDMMTVNDQAGPISLEANQPFMVIQYAEGSTCVGVGDPAMVVVPSLEQFIDKVSYATATYVEFTSHFSYILLKTSSIGTLKINGNVISASAFTTFSAEPQYSYANIKLPDGNHLVECKDGFLMIAYGYGKDISYAYIGGSNFKNLEHIIDISAPKCDSLNFAMANIGNTSFILSSTWDFGDGTGDTGLSVVKRYAKHGVYKVANIITSIVKATPDTVFQIIKTLVSPNAGFSINDTAQCFNKNFFVIEDTTKFIAGSNKKRTSWLSSHISSPSFDSTKIVRQYSDTGIYTVTLVAEADNGCTGIKKQNLYVYPQTAVKVLFDDTIMCFKNHAFGIHNTSTVSNGYVAKSNWMYSDGDTSSLFSPPSKKFDSAGVYQVKGIMTTDKGCVDSMRQQLTLHPSITPNFKTTPVCLGDTSFFTNTSVYKNGEVARWLWGFNNTDSALTFNSRYLYADTGVYTVSLAAFTQHGCADTTTKMAIANVSPKPKAYFTAYTTDSSGFSYTYQFTNGSVGGTSYLWDFDNTSQSSDVNPQYKYFKTGIYKIMLTTTNAYDCKDSYDTLLSIFLPIEIYIPNAFTPGDKDALNPVFKVGGIVNAKRFEMLIFDRWGELIFKSNDMEQGWDGTYKDNPAPIGVYMYIVNIIAEAKVLNYRGTLNLLR